MSEREIISGVTPALRQAADDLLKLADGDENEAYSLAIENADRDDIETEREFWFAYDLRVLCHHRANAAYEGFTLIEIIEPHGAEPARRLFDLEISE